MYETMSERSETVFPVPEGISRTQWPYKWSQSGVLLQSAWSPTPASRVSFRSVMYEYCSEGRERRANIVRYGTDALPG